MCSSHISLQCSCLVENFSMSFTCCDTLEDSSPSSRRCSLQYDPPEPRNLIRKLSLTVNEPEQSPSTIFKDNAKNWDVMGEQPFHNEPRSPLREVQGSSPSATALCSHRVWNAEHFKLCCSTSPDLPPSWFGWRKVKPFNRSPFGQIYSPLGRMRLISPTGSPKSPPTTSNSISDSDGFDLSEEFSREELQAEPISSAVSSLIHSSNLSPLSEVQRSKLKRPCNEVREHSNKRPPLPFPSPPSNSSTPIRETDSKTRTSLRGSVLFRTQSSPPIYPGGLTKRDGLIGDFTKPLILPLVKGTILDLNCISADTLGSLLTGQISDVTSYTIIDCRFPYEYAGGHIAGAKNIWTDREMKRVMFSKSVHYSYGGSRDIIIFHCEFSSKRGPERSRFLREYDRRVNQCIFPKLHYPELYLLDGGYRVFYEKYADLCSPSSYCPMEDPAHIEELRACKLRLKQEKLKTCQLRSKTWNVKVDSILK